MTGEQLEIFGHNDNALFPPRRRWNGHQWWFPIDFLLFGEPQGEIFQNFLLKLKVKMYCKVYELIKLKKKKMKNFPIIIS